MNILEAIVKLRNDLKTWVTNNLNSLNTKIDSKTSFSGDYNDLTNKPNIAEDNDDSMIIADEAGNVIFQVDEAGTHTTDVNVSGTSILSKIPVWDNKSDFSGDYNDLKNKPNIDEDNTGDLTIADEAGNVIVKVDESGINTTDVNVSGTSILSKIPVWDNKSDFSGDYNDLKNRPGIEEDNTGDLTIADEAGNIILKVDEAGTHTTDVNIAGTSIASKIPVWDGKSDFSGDYNDLKNKPNIEEDNEGNLTIADEAGNVIFQVNEAGTHTTSLSLNGKDISETIKEHTDNTNIHVTEKEKSDWNNKVDKIDGKGLSTEDYTTSDKNKLNSIEEGANKTVIDSEISNTSTNPVQNKVIYDKLNELTGMESVSSQISNALKDIDAPVTSVNNKTGDVVLGYEDIENAPEIVDDASKELVITDPNGNIIFRADETGLNATMLSIDGVNIDDYIESKFTPITTEQIKSLFEE